MTPMIRSAGWPGWPSPRGCSNRAPPPATIARSVGVPRHDRPPDGLQGGALMAGHTRLRAELAAELAETRRRTLTLAGAAQEEHRRQVHPYYSPMGWHLGHMGMTEAFWVLGRAKG